MLQHRIFSKTSRDLGLNSIQTVTSGNNRDPEITKSWAKFKKHQIVYWFNTQNKQFHYFFFIRFHSCFRNILKLLEFERFWCPICTQDDMVQTGTSCTNFSEQPKEPFHVNYEMRWDLEKGSEITSYLLSAKLYFVLLIT